MADGPIVLLERHKLGKGARDELTSDISNAFDLYRQALNDIATRHGRYVISLPFSKSTESNPYSFIQ
jgi:hypothetical protein